MERRKYCYNPVKLYRLDVQVNMTFAGDDARAARRYIYDFLRKYPFLFAGFKGPRDPITMGFQTSSGYYAKEMVGILLERMIFEDLEIKLRYICPGAPEHQGTVQFGRRRVTQPPKTSNKANVSSQMKLF